MKMAPSELSPARSRHRSSGSVSLACRSKRPRSEWTFLLPGFGELVGFVAPAELPQQLLESPHRALGLQIAVAARLAQRVHHLTDQGLRLREVAALLHRLAEPRLVQ